MSYKDMTYTTTLLCDVVNEEKENLRQILDGVDSDAEQVKVRIIREIEEKLIVTSWNDFLKKFTPTLYEVPVIDPETERVSMVFTTKNPGIQDAQKITFTRNNPLVQSFLQLMERRTMDGQTNAYFDFSQALKNSMSPETLHKKAEVLKSDMKYLASKYESLKKGDPEKDVVGRRLATKLQETREFFYNKTSLLQLAQTTVGQQLLSIAAPPSSRKKESAPLALTYASFDITEDGIQAKQLEPANMSQLQTENEAGQQLLLSYIGKYYDKVTETTEEYVENEAGELVLATVEQKQTPYQKQLVLSALTGSPLTNAIENLPQTVQQYNMYVDATASVMENYFEAVSELFSKIIGVKQFFDEYEAHAKTKKVTPRLLIANSTVESLVAEKDKLKTYIKSVQAQSAYADHGICSVIIPGVLLQENTEVEEVDDLFAHFVGGEESNKEQTTDVQITDVKTIASLFNPYRVPVFFGFKGEASTFEEIVDTSFTKTIQPFLQKLKGAEADWQKTLVPCYPNITIIPENTQLTTAKQVELDVDTVKQGEDRNIQMPGFYIDASYIAASLVAAHTCTGYLEGKYKVNESTLTPDFSGARISYAEKGTKTLLPIEIKVMAESLLHKVDQLGVGFVLASQNINAAEGKVYVYSANTCEKNENENENEKVYPLHRMLVERFVWYEVGALTKKEEYEKALSEKHRGALGKKIKDSEGRYFNALFKEDEGVTFNSDSNELQFKFKQDTSKIKVKIQ